MKKTNRLITIAGLTGVTMLAAPAFAQAGDDAASGPVLRAEGFAGAGRDQRPLSDSETEFSGGFLPSIAVPLGDMVTVQADGLIARHLGDTVTAVGGRIAARPSENISIGIYGSYVNFDGPDYGAGNGAVDLETYRIGAEATLSFDRVVISAVAGQEHSERQSVVAGTIPGFTIIDSYGYGSSFFSMADIDFYPTDNIGLSVGHRYIGRRHAAALSAETSFGPSSAFSVFAEGRIGSEGYTAGWAGIRIRFGHQGAPLRITETRRIFENRLKDELFASGNTRRRTRDVIEPPAPPEPPVDNCSCGGSYCGQ